jgi:hypothetical protein
MPTPPSLPACQPTSLPASGLARDTLVALKQADCRGGNATIVTTTGREQCDGGLLRCTRAALREIERSNHGPKALQQETRTGPLSSAHLQLATGDWALQHFKEQVKLRSVLRDQSPPIRRFFACNQCSGRFALLGLFHNPPPSPLHLLLPSSTHTSPHSSPRHSSTKSILQHHLHVPHHFRLHRLCSVAVTHPPLPPPRRQPPLAFEYSPFQRLPIEPWSHHEDESS